MNFIIDSEMSKKIRVVLEALRSTYQGKDTEQITNAERILENFSMDSQFCEILLAIISENSEEVTFHDKQAAATCLNKDLNLYIITKQIFDQKKEYLQTTLQNVITQENLHFKIVDELILG